MHKKPKGLSLEYAEKACSVLIKKHFAHAVLHASPGIRPEKTGEHEYSIGVMYGLNDSLNQAIEKEQIKIKMDTLILVAPVIQIYVSP